MLYEDSASYPLRRSDDTDSDHPDHDGDQDPRQLLADLAVLVDAGLVVPVRDGTGELRMTPAGRLHATASGLRVTPTGPQEESDS
jgi:hypothetical protein